MNIYRLYIPLAQIAQLKKSAYLIAPINANISYFFSFNSKMMIDVDQSSNDSVEFQMRLNFSYPFLFVIQYIIYAKISFMLNMNDSSSNNNDV